ncbi:MAG: potassium/proton antiporter [Alphaproteobacteria bacterium]|nr:potassium/proton antiporter [Alphaproteobacteria bacterium]MBU0796760.1 potassium/proton antiporter [Alphaproteobacteria bacterium]MBU0888276.1 potassium/proton antiporter [Alphaproteobacteria bacterium]MBU1811477.1 potassium/proton antiporter [Alphaproteobacteria bacterium]
MDIANQLILLGSALLLVSILAGMLSSRIGAPLLLVFLGLGMVAGEDGLGVQFDNFESAYLIGSLALAIILFDGGLRTPLRSIRVAWGPASVLASLGVLLTAAITGGAAIFLLDLSPLAGLLTGAIVASTDAAAVFLLLHQRGMELRRRLGATLEVESGVNDPMAVFLTITLVELVVAGGGDITFTVLHSFLLQLGLGAVFGIGGGLLLAVLVNRLDLAPGLYPVFVIAAACAMFGLTQVTGGSGFLAVYLAGIVAGNRRLRANQLIRRFHDGMAWISQIVMFLILGLLVTPSSLVEDIVPGTIIALVLIFIARPIATFICLLPFSFTREEKLFISWVGLRGAVPIFLAIIPVLGGLDNAMQYFNVTFIVVLLSLLLQGWTIPLVARRLNLELPPVSEAEGRVDLDLSPQIDRDLVGYRLTETATAVSKPFRNIQLPPRVRLIVVLRDGSVVPKYKIEALYPGDYVLLLCPPEEALAADKLFSGRRGYARREVRLGDFVFAGTKKMGSLADEYDLPVNRQQRDLTVGQLLANLLPNSPSIGDRVAIGTVELVIRAIQDEQITEVGLVLEPGKLHLLPPGLSGRLATLVARLRRRPVTVDGNDRADEPPVPPRPGLLQRLRTALLRQ